ncbi:MAG: PIN domain-containing protein [Desulfurococcales archaeon]|nr:PIN domain-containing protein [Desulfurococcales archaeon]
MRLVVDTNIAFSILIGGVRLRRLFLTMRGAVTLVAPRRIIEEVEKLVPRAAEYVGAEPQLMREIYNTIIKPYIEVVNEEDIPESIREEAWRLVHNVDPDDWPFVALAMHLGVPLWTGDRGLLRLSAETGFRYFTAIDTEGVEMLLEGAPLGEVRERMKKKYEAGI